METIKKNTLNKLLKYLSSQEQFIFLDTSKPQGENNKSLLFMNPLERLQFVNGDSVSEFLNRIEMLQESGFYVAGWISYEFGCLLEPALQEKLSRSVDEGAVLADLGVFNAPYFFHHETGETDFPLAELTLENDEWKVDTLTLSQRREEYIEAIQTVREYIRAGDTYQVNYTLKLFFDFHGSVEGFYRDLRRNQSVAYGAYIRWGEERVLSFSPELFFERRENEIRVKPMKGTLKRGRTLQEDEANCQHLAQDIKNRSENVMIVDLLRNDLGRLMHYIAEGKVQVDSLFDVEVFETLLQMTSTITGTAPDSSLSEVSLLNFFKAIFPCGSVTGAPKIRTMEIIDELETQRRGVYTGAIGYLSPTGDGVFNVPIRTVVLNGEKGEMGIGSGIVYDSDPESEWDECLLKGRFLTHPRKEFYLFETLLWSPGSGYVFLNEHLARLSESSSFFLFSCDREKVAASLLEYGQRLKGGQHMRVRFLLNKDGSHEIESVACEAPKDLCLPEVGETLSSGLPRFSFSEERVDRDEVWFYHKTSRRELYDKEYRRAQERGLFDLCFCNSQGEVTEGCITNIVILKDTKYYTPPRTSGLLGGVMRERLLKDPLNTLEEVTLTPEDIRGADAVFLCNSVRGVVQVQLAD